MAGKKVKVAIVGPGNIGTDLMYKVFRSQYLEMSLMLGVVESEGIKRARSKGVEVSTEGINYLVQHSAPTSMGKSFIMEVFIKNRIHHRILMTARNTEMWCLPIRWRLLKMSFSSAYQTTSCGFPICTLPSTASIPLMTITGMSSWNTARQMKSRCSCSGTGSPVSPQTK